MFRQRKKGLRFKQVISLAIQSKGQFRTPDLLIILNPRENQVALKEAQILGIPVIALLDRNVCVKNIIYPIPINDDSLKGVKLWLGLVIEALKLSKNSMLVEAPIEEKQAKFSGSSERSEVKSWARKEYYRLKKVKVKKFSRRPWQKKKNVFKSKK